MVIPVVFVVLAAAAVVAVRLARVKGVVHTNAGCDACGRGEPSAALRFFRNTGMVVLFRWETLGGTWCRRCAADHFLRMTLWTMTLGWWGFISFFVNFAFIANNVGNLLWALTLPSGDALATSTLEQHREYALNLLATKDFEDVVYVLRQVSGCPAETVRLFLRSLTPAR